MHTTLFYSKILVMELSLPRCRDMYPNSSKFAVEAYQDATSVRYGYLLVDLKSDQDERCRLRTNIFPGETQYAYVKKQKVV